MRHIPVGGNRQFSRYEELSKTRVLAFAFLRDYLCVDFRYRASLEGCVSNKWLATNNGAHD